MRSAMLEWIGIGLGRIDLALERDDFVAGDLVRGRLSLRLKEPVPARGLHVGVRARQRRLERHVTRGGGPTLSYSRHKVWEFTRRLAAEGVFEVADHDFELRLPDDVFRGMIEPPPGMLGEVARAVSFLAGSARFPLEWEVFGRLDIPFRLDVHGEASIVVGEGHDRGRPAGRG